MIELLSSVNEIGDNKVGHVGKVGPRGKATKIKEVDPAAGLARISSTRSPWRAVLCLLVC